MTGMSSRRHGAAQVHAGRPRSMHPRGATHGGTGVGGMVRSLVEPLLMLRGLGCGGLVVSQGCFSAKKSEWR